MNTNDHLKYFVQHLRISIITAYGYTGHFICRIPGENGQFTIWINEQTNGK